MEWAIVPSSISRRAAARPIMPRGRRGVLHGNGAVLLSGSGTMKLQKWPNYLPISGNVGGVGASSTPTKLLADTSAL